MTAPLLTVLQHVLLSLIVAFCVVMRAIIHVTSTSKHSKWRQRKKQNALFDKKLAEEEAWIRQGIKARRTRNEGRVRALKALREESKARRSQQGKVSMATQEANRSGKLVFEIEHLRVSYNEQPLIKDFSAIVLTWRPYWSCW